MDKPTPRPRRIAAAPRPATKAAAAPQLPAPAVIARFPAASVAICTYERYDLLAGALQAAAAQAASFDDYEILLIDNTADADRSLIEYRRHRATPRLRWVHEPRRGLSCARNRAVAESRAPIIAFLDDDSVPDDDWLQSIMAAFDAFGACAMAIGGRVTPVWLGKRPAWLSDGLLKYLSVTDLGEDVRVLDEGEWIVGANMALRRETFDTVGRFPEHLGRKGEGSTLLSNDETALLQQIRAQGGVIAYTPHAQVGHLIDPSRLSQAWFRRRLAWQAVSDYLEDPQSSARQASRSWDWLTGFLVKLPPSQRTYRGLLTDMPNAALLDHQLNAVYSAAVCLLHGVELEDFQVPAQPDKR